MSATLIQPGDRIRDRIGLWPGAVALALVLSLFVPDTVAAAARTPAQNARIFLDSIATKDWAGAAKHYDPQSSGRLKASIWPAIAREMNCGHDGYFRRVLGDGADFYTIAVADPLPFAAAMLGRLHGQAANAGLILGNGKVVGTVDEGKNLRHVIVRTEVGTARFKLERMIVLTFERLSVPAPETAWGLLVGSELKSFVFRLRQAFRPECKKQ